MKQSKVEKELVMEKNVCPHCKGNNTFVFDGNNLFTENFCLDCIVHFFIDR